MPIILSCEEVNVLTFHRGDFEIEDAARYWRPSTLSTPEIVGHVHDLILTDRFRLQ